MSCVDFRIVDEIMDFLKKKGLTDTFDQIVVPGASLAISYDIYQKKEFSYWPHTTLQQIEIMVKLHNIKKIIFFDHLGCCMHKVVFGIKSNTEEFNKHLEIMKIAKQRIQKKLGSSMLVQFQGYILNFDGNIWSVAI